MESKELAGIRAALDLIRQEIGGLNERLVALEMAQAVSAPVASIDVPSSKLSSSKPSASKPTSSKPQMLDEELVIVLSAAIAAYLGVKPRIRQIRLLGDAAWAQHGRATIQASHALAVYRS